MSTLDHDDIPPRPSELDALSSPTFKPSQKAALWSRIEASAVAVPPLPSPGHALPGTISAHAAVASSLGALVAGAIGAHYLWPAAPQIIERVEVREVRFEVPVPAPVVPAVENQPPTRSPPSPPKASKPRPTPPDTELERKMLGSVRTALLRREPAAALAGLQQLDAQVPEGLLLEERESLRLQALSLAERHDEARAAARAFIKRYPTSVFGPAAEAVLNDSP